MRVSIAFYTCICCCGLRGLCPDASRVGSPQRRIWKDVDTSDTTALAFLWRSLGLRVAKNWFLHTDAENDDTMIVFSPCGIPSSIFFMMPVCVSNAHHLSQFPDCLIAVALAIPSVVSRMLLVTIYRR